MCLPRSRAAPASDTVSLLNRCAADPGLTYPHGGGESLYANPLLTFVGLIHPRAFHYETCKTGPRSCLLGLIHPPPFHLTPRPTCANATDCDPSRFQCLSRPRTPLFSSRPSVSRGFPTSLHTALATRTHRSSRTYPKPRIARTHRDSRTPSHSHHPFPPCPNPPQAPSDHPPARRRRRAGAERPQPHTRNRAIWRGFSAPTTKPPHPQRTRGPCTSNTNNGTLQPAYSSQSACSGQTASTGRLGSGSNPASSLSLSQILTMAQVSSSQ